MDNSGEVAERIVRLSMDGAIATVKITGTGAKHLAILLHAALNDRNKTSGKVKLASMLKSGKELKVFTLTEDNLKQFASEVKRYGVTYSALRDKNPKEGHPAEIMVRAEDSAKIKRIFEKLGFGNVDISTIETDTGRAAQEAAQNPPERSESAENPDKGSEAPIQKESGETENPFAAQTGKSPPSADTSKKRVTEGRGLNDGKKSVRKEIAKMRRDRYGTRTGGGREKAIENRMAAMQEREQILNAQIRPKSTQSREGR